MTQPTSHDEAMKLLDYVEAECKMAPRFVNTLLLANLLVHAERQTELLEEIAAALRPEITETKIDPHAPAHERGV